jgi:UDP-3-O-[3-hydroxymyristoyl] N-acetylglucosamine deacetylase
MLKQRTLKTTIKTTGVGLHTGARVELVLRPASPNSGIVFHRIEHGRSVALPADALHVGDTRLSSTLKHDGASISTVEHRCRTRGLGIDNLNFDVATGAPVWTAAPRRSCSCCIRPASSSRMHRRTAHPCTVEVKDGDKWARFDPYHGFKLDFTIDFPHPMFGSENRHVVIDFALNSYVKEVARARTFGFMQEVEAMREAGLGLGGSLQNAIVLDEFKVLNSEGLPSTTSSSSTRSSTRSATSRWGTADRQYTAYKSGHGLNNAVARALAKSDAFELITFANRPKFRRHSGLATFPCDSGSGRFRGSATTSRRAARVS